MKLLVLFLFFVSYECTKQFNVWGDRPSDDNDDTSSNSRRPEPVDLPVVPNRYDWQPECTSFPTGNKNVDGVLICTKIPSHLLIGKPSNFTVTVQTTLFNTQQEVILYLEPAAGIDVMFHSATFSDGVARSPSHGSRVRTYNLGVIPSNNPLYIDIPVIARSGDGEADICAWAEYRQMACDCGELMNPRPAILVRLMDLKDPIKINEYVYYELVVTNQGSSDLEMVEIVAAWDQSELEFVTAHGPTDLSVLDKTCSKSNYRLLGKGTKLKAQMEDHSDPNNYPSRVCFTQLPKLLAKPENYVPLPDDWCFARLGYTNPECARPLPSDAIQGINHARWVFQMKAKKTTSTLFAVWIADKALTSYTLETETTQLI